MTLNFNFIFLEKNLFLATIAYLIMILNSYSLHSPILGLAVFLLFVSFLGNWIGGLWNRNSGLVNFLIGCFTLISLIVILMGVIVYFMVFSAILMWFVLGILLSTFYLFELYLNGATKIAQKPERKFKFLTLRIFLKFKVLFLIVAVFSEILIAFMSITGDAIGHVGVTIPHIFWLILFLSFVLEYLIYKDQSIPFNAKLVLGIFLTLIIFGLPSIVYKYYVTEDSFVLLGVTKSIIETGIYGWAPNTFKTGFFGLIALVSVGSSAEIIVDWIYKALTPILVSVYVPLFFYLLLKKIIRRANIFAVLISLFLFPISVFLSIPLEKNLATIFFMGVLAFSSFLVADKKIIKANLAILCLALLATSMIHDYFVLYAIIPLILAVFLRVLHKKFTRITSLIMFLILCFTIMLIPTSFVAASSITGRESTVFAYPKIESVMEFWMPQIIFPANISFETISFLYLNNFTWIRYAVAVLGILIISKASVTFASKNVKLWLLMTIISFWLGYFLLKTATQNPPEAANEYRFGFFLDISLISLCGVAFYGITDRLSNWKIRTKYRLVVRENSGWLSGKKLNLGLRFSTLAVIIMIAIVTISIYSGYSFDNIMDRPISAEDYGRYVVSDSKIEAMNYIKDVSQGRKSVILSDNHMAKIALGAIGVWFEKAELLHLNSGGELNLYFNEMRVEPDSDIIMTLINKTNSEIGFFIIGLEDWKGWYSDGTNWIEQSSIEQLKSISDDWKTFGENDDLYVFMFNYKP